MRSFVQQTAPGRCRASPPGCCGRWLLSSRIAAEGWRTGATSRGAAPTAAVRAAACCCDALPASRCRALRCHRIRAHCSAAAAGGSLSTPPLPTHPPTPFLAGPSSRSRAAGRPPTAGSASRGREGRMARRRVAAAGAGRGAGRRLRPSPPRRRRGRAWRRGRGGARIGSRRVHGGFLQGRAGHDTGRHGRRGGEFRALG